MVRKFSVNSWQKPPLFALRKKIRVEKLRKYCYNVSIYCYVPP